MDRPVDPDSVEGLLRRVLTGGGSEGRNTVVNEQVLHSFRALYDGGGKSALMASSRGTPIGASSISWVCRLADEAV